MGNHVMIEKQEVVESLFSFLADEKGLDQPRVHYLGDPHRGRYLAARGFIVVYTSKELEVRFNYEAGMHLPSIVIDLPGPEEHAWIDLDDILRHLEIVLEEPKGVYSRDPAEAGWVETLTERLFRRKEKRARYLIDLSQYAETLQKHFEVIVGFAKSEGSIPLRDAIPVGSL